MKPKQSLSAIATQLEKKRVRVSFLKQELATEERTVIELEAELRVETSKVLKG